MSNRQVYYDSQHRYLHDTEFHAAVEAMVDMGYRNGFTPGELKQIAFQAALFIEQRYGQPAAYVHPRGFNLLEDK